jgi:AcrR family transcriptional regulator
MAPLIDRDKLARRRESRQERRVAVAAAARAAFHELPYARVSLDAVGQRAGLRQGAAGLFFSSREEVFLELIGEELDAWHRHLEEELGRSTGAATTAELVALLVDSVGNRGALRRLLGLLPTVVEQGTDAVAIHRLELDRHRAMVSLGALLERRWTALRPGAGARLLRRFELVVAALAQGSGPAGMTAVVLQDPELEALATDLGAELAALTHGLVGAAMAPEG